MYHLDDRELDRLSAAAGEHYQPPGTPDWDALEQTLDKELPQKKDKRRRGLIWFFLLPGLFIAGAAYWYTRPAGKPKAPIAVNSGAQPGKNISPASTPGAAANTNTTNTTTLPNESPLLPSPKRNTATANKNENANETNNTDKTKHLNSTNRPNNTNDAVSHPTYQPSHTASNSNNEKQHLLGPAMKKRTNGRLGNNFTTSNNQLNGRTSLTHNNRKGSSQPIADAAHTGAVGDRSNDQLADKSGKDQVTATQKDGPPTTPPATAPHTGVSAPPASDTPAVVKTTLKKTDSTKTPGKTTKAKHPEKAFGIGVTGGMDMSTVKFNYSTNAGYNIGLTLGYHFSKSWSVYTGAIYTKKNYRLEGYDYHAPASSWISVYNVKIDEVNGNCNMWELPLVGRYTFGARTNTAARFFAGAGISSYLMNREYYSYDYKRNGNPVTAEMTNTKHSQFWFSVLDFSAGIEKPLGHHLVGQLEPYAKLPLQGLGTGKIMLSSFGLNVTLQYRKKLGK